MLFFWFTMKHSYSLDEKVWKLLYLLMQFVHNREQCVLHSEAMVPLREGQTRTRRGLFERLRCIFLYRLLDWNELYAAIELPFQVRWDTS